ncbi:hypothetical protein DXD55_06325 [Bacteroides stercoris]|nr:hypothetical protein DXD55_06325 [Bacteroides stercoris]
MSVSLQCVFHSIRFKVNKGWSTAVLLFFMPVRQDELRGEIMKSMIINHSRSYDTEPSLSPVCFHRKFVAIQL